MFSISPPALPSQPPPPAVPSSSSSSSRFEVIDDPSPSPSTPSATKSTSSTASAPSKTSTRATATSLAAHLPDSIRHLLQNPTALLTDRRYFWVVAGALLLWESLVSVVILRKVRYTEIDFSTYLQQAELFLKGERDYSRISGESGLCVYPASHLYLYSLLHYLVQPVFGTVDGVPARIIGGHLERAQYVFAGVYVASLACVMVVYSRCKRIPPYLLPLLCISKRLHSIYVLRMFNDGLAMFFFYAALVLYTTPDGEEEEGKGGEEAGGKAKGKAVGWGRALRWVVGTVLFSLALNIKMSILLFLPGLLYLLFVYHSPLVCTLHITLLLSSQVLLALPFLLPSSPALLALRLSDLLASPELLLAPARIYVNQAYEFSRSFLYEFTVNWRWLADEELFLSEGFKHALLLAHAVGLVVFAVRWAQEEGGVGEVLERAVRRPMERPAKRRLTPERTATILFTSNFLGILCARSLHNQFYAWFAWQGVWMVFGAGTIWEPMQGLLLLSLLEYAFATYPSTQNSSLGFCIAMMVILAGVYYGRVCGEGAEEEGVQREGEGGRGKTE